MMKKPKYIMMRIREADYKLLQKARVIMGKQPEMLRVANIPLGWTVGTLAEYYLKRKGK